MVDLGSTELFIPGPTLSREDFQEYSTRLFDDWEARLQQELSLPDYSISLEVEEGSVTAVAAVAATLGAIYTGISKYNSFLGGLTTITKQVRAAGDYFAHRATEPFTRLNLQPRVRRRTGTLGRLQRLLRRVQHQELSVEEAITEAQNIVGSDADTAPEFMLQLSTTIVTVGRHPEQLVLPMDLPEEVEPEPTPAVTRGPRSDAPKVPGPPRPRFRVEVWRESRTGKREVRITEL